eukprot:gene7361-8143_t
MICRDEEVNLRSNLPLWTEAVDYFVFLLDDRTIDKSRAAIHTILTPRRIPHVIKNYTFTGFGAARTLSLQTAYDNFANASHVLIADPDWRPDLQTLRKEELDLSADAFRFTVFDRNGMTKRSMDWLLRHRAGLAMRYSLHEVLDIGYYQVKIISWVAHEIEQAGSWHATVGHGHSMSQARYEFDLRMLYNDLPLYGHDPHLHYYLGITHHARLEAMHKAGGAGGEAIASDLQAAIAFLELRAQSVYEHDFVEERWGAMLTLGTIYYTYQKDFVRSSHWLKMCRDYNPKHFECSLHLLHVLLSQGLQAEAVAELEHLVTLKMEAKLMLNMLNVEDCAVPQAIATVWPLKTTQTTGTLSEYDALYLLLQLRRLEAGRERCGVEAENSEAVWQLVDRSLRAAQSPLSVSWSLETLCSHEKTFLLLLTRRYEQHPCSAVTQRIARELQCRAFFLPLPPASEELQGRSWARGFRGAALLADLAQHIYASDRRPILGRSPHATTNNSCSPSSSTSSLFCYNPQLPYRVLFLEHFHVEMVFNLVGSFHRLGFDYYELHIVHSRQEVLHYIRDVLASCLPEDYLLQLHHYPKIRYIHQDHVTFLANAASNSLLFDYVESNGALHHLTNETARRHYLRGVKEVLSPVGAIGLTFFQHSLLTERWEEMVSMRENTSFPPFSVKQEYLVDAYLDLLQRDHLVHDDDLRAFLSATAPQRRSAFSREEVEGWVAEEKLAVRRWLPAGYSTPYTSLPHYAVQRMRALGVPEKLFLHLFSTSFRLTSYLTAAEDSLPLPLPVLSVDLLGSEEAAGRIRIVDRLGSLGSIFQASFANPAVHVSPQRLVFHSLSLQGAGGGGGDQAIDLIAPPSIAFLCMHLSDEHESLHSLLTQNRAYNQASKVNQEEEEEEHLSAVLHLLNTLLQTNLITLACDDCSLWDFQSRREEKHAVLYGERLAHICSSSSSSNGVCVVFSDDCQGRQALQQLLADRRRAVYLFSSPCASPLRGSEKCTVTSSPTTCPASLDQLLLLLLRHQREQQGWVEEVVFHLSSCSSAEALLVALRPFLSAGTTLRFLPPPPPPTTPTSHCEKRLLPSWLAFLAQQHLAALSQEEEEGDYLVARLLPHPELPTPPAPAPLGEVAAGFKAQEEVAVEQKQQQQEEGVVEVKQKLSRILDILSTLSTTSSSSTTSPTTTTTSSSLIEGLEGGMLSRLSQTLALSSAITSPEAKDATTAVAGEEEEEEEERFALEASAIVLPSTALPADQLQTTYRSRSCARSAKQQQEEEEGKKSCAVPARLKRRTAALLKTSIAKVLFDLAQLDAIRELYPLHNSEEVAGGGAGGGGWSALNNLSLRYFEEVRSAHEEVLRYLIHQQEQQRRPAEAEQEIVKLPSSSSYPDLAASISFLHRAHYLFSPGLTASTTATPTLYREARRQLRYLADQEVLAGGQGGQLDYLVVDHLLRPAAYDLLAKTILASQLFFDLANGIAFLAHFEEGLGGGILQTFAQQLAWALTPSRGDSRWRVSKVLALAMNQTSSSSSLGTNQTSALFVAGRDDVVATVFLHLPTPSSSSTTSSSTTSSSSFALQIFNPQTAQALFARGLSLYPATHSDLLSRHGQLRLAVQQFCPHCEADVVPSRANRVVLSRGHCPLQLLVLPPPTPPPPSPSSPRRFQEEVVAALFIVLSEQHH